MTFVLSDLYMFVFHGHAKAVVSLKELPGVFPITHVNTNSQWTPKILARPYFQPLSSRGWDIPCYTWSSPVPSNGTQVLK